MNTRIFTIVWKQFTERPLRSALTIVGVVIGITALVALIILSNGLKQGVSKQLDVFGSDEILLTPKASSGRGMPTGYGFMTTDDIKTIKSVPQVLFVDSLLQGTFDIKYGRESNKVTVIGVGKDKNSDRTAKDYFNMDLVVGRYIEESDYKTANIGYRVAHEFFDKDIVLGTTIQIKGDKYRVVGIFEDQGTFAKDTAIYVPIDGLRDTIGDSKALTSVSATISPGVDLDEMVERLKKKLERARGKDDINIITPKQLKERINSLLGVIDFVVISIALISLFVGALGIMNSMFTSVIQRTREIGIMKAVGAKNSQILSLFLLESIIFGLLGGIIGVLLGISLSFGIIDVVNSFGFMRIEMVPDYILFASAIIFSTLIGIISGLLPAIRASRLRPVDALRYE
ncbi:MAG: FtsX-like permease family protein [Candidatus Micrarchaeota archaeon]|nr:FtsX-like permease family protein [Candidatus Micrarchaeota archaeon]